jgi:hypothetical protein
MADRAWVATRKGLFPLKRSGNGWQVGKPSFLGDPVSMVLEDPRDKTVYAALNLGHFGVKLRRSSDGGANWQEVGVPVFPDQSEAKPEDKTPWKLVQIWSLEPGGKDEPGALWAGAIPAGLFRSTDRGDTWTLVRSLWDRPERLQWFGGGYDHAGIHSVMVDPRNSRHVTLAISCGGVWQSRDGGATWNVTSKGMRADFMPPDQAGDPNIQDPHRVVQSPSAPETLWCQHHCDIFKSTDGGISWANTTGFALSRFGFAVAVHPRDPQTAWFAPGVKDECRVPVDGKLAVTRTRDGGKTFEALGKGLPQADCYDIVYRHCLEVDESGERLLMGSTTGNLWASHDSGESWQAVSGNLPPILSLRFAQG